MKNKPLSASAKNRLVRQGMAHIAALEKRLGTCDLRDFENVKSALLSERAAVQALAA